MHVLILRADLHLPVARSLKAKRSSVTPLIKHLDRLAGVAASEVASIAVPYSGFSSLCFSTDGNLLAVGSRSGELRVYETGRWEEPTLEQTEPDVQVVDVKFAADQHQFAVAYSDGNVKLVDVLHSEPTFASIKINSTPLSLSFCESPDQLAIGTQSGEIHTIDTVTFQTAQVVKAHSSRINALACFPQGDRLVSGGRDRELRIWDLRSGELVAALAGHARQVFAIAVSPDGRTAASGGLGGDIRLWRSDR